MVKIRLTRAGAKKRPYYHVIATDSRNRRDGAYLENLGAYDPMCEPVTIKLNTERIDYWVKNGAQLSETVASLLRRHKHAARQEGQSEAS